jgi:hypothetical protein
MNRKLMVRYIPRNCDGNFVTGIPFSAGGLDGPVDDQGYNRMCGDFMSFMHNW